MANKAGHFEPFREKVQDFAPKSPFPEVCLPQVTIRSLLSFHKVFDA